MWFLAEDNRRRIETRFQVDRLARFNRVDSLVVNMPGGWLDSPQRQHPYAFVQNGVQVNNWWGHPVDMNEYAQSR